MQVVPLAGDDSDEPSEETLPRRPFRRPRWVDIGGVLVVVASILVFAAVSGPPTPMSTLTLPEITNPNQLFLCGAHPADPIVAPPLTSPTGIRLVGGGTLQAVDVDTTQVSDRPAVVALTKNALQDGKVVSHIEVTGNDVYVLLSKCSPSSTTNTVIRLSGELRTPAVLPVQVDYLLPGSDRVWGVLVSKFDEAGVALSPSVLVPLTGDAPMDLPMSFLPIAGVGDNVLGVRSTAGDPTSTVEIIDPRTGKAIETLGKNEFLADAPVGFVFARNGFAVWVDRPCGGPKVCRLHRYDLHTQTLRTVDGTPGANDNLWPQDISPDGALMVGRSGLSSADAQLRLDVIDLRTGLVTAVPGIVSLADAPTGVAFSSDSAWLIIAVAQADGAKFLLWHAGMPEPVLAPFRLIGPLGYNLPIGVVG